MSEDKKYKTGQMQDNGLMYDTVYDFNKDGKVDWVEDSIRREEIKKSQERFEESRQQSSPTPKPQASAASGSGCLGSFLTVLFCLGGIGLCFATDSVGAKILFIFGGFALGLLSAYFSGLFGNKPKEAALEKDISNISIDKKKLIKRITIVSAILITTLLLCNIGNIKNAHYYRTAISLINAGDYESAQEALSKIEEHKYKEKTELYEFCYALENLAKGKRVNGPDYSYNPYSFDFRFSDEIEKKRETINRQLTQQKEEAERKKAEQSQSTADSYSRENIPYVGMGESGLYSTSLGTPKVKKNFNRECINGQQYWANKYDYYRNGRIIFTARCVRGKVTQVWDYRSEAESTPVNYGSSNSRSKSKTVDPYDVNNYSNEEDFYYDHYDDFFDYYEAEDYYNDHHD